MLPTDVATLRRNRLLSTIHDQELLRFTDLLTLHDFARGEVVAEPYRETDRVIFPIDGVFSVVAETSDGDQVEAGMIGNEGIVGLGPFLGARTSVLRTLCQIPGSGVVADVDALLARADGALATAARRYAMSFLTMASQGSACNRLHGIEQRAARWLLMTDDRIDRNPFELTHEFFAIMLGAHRPSVTLAADALRKAGLIDYQRGHVQILDRPGLEAAACECYGLITDEYERATGTRLRSASSGHTSDQPLA